MGCNGCGSCCDPVFLTFGPADVTRRLANPRLGGRLRRDFEFFRQHWHKVRGKISPTKGVVTWEYTCDMFDPQTHSCTTYTNRPLVCEEHPLYPEHKNSDLGAHVRYLEGHTPDCSFIAEGRSRLVIVAINGRAA